MSNIRLDVPRNFRTSVLVEQSEWLFNQAKSQAGQELFVIAMTGGQTNGAWLEIGCGDPIRSSNTYLLEKRLGWSGTSIDAVCMDQDIVTPFEEYWWGFYSTVRRPHWPKEAVSPELVPDQDFLQNIPYFKNFIQRQITDADQIPKSQRNWKSVRPNTQFHQIDAFDFDYALLPKQLDYLQIDIHPSSNNLLMLHKVIPTHSFAVITFEHDAWDHTSTSARVRQQSREFLALHGYEMVISDVTVPPGHGNGIGDEPINFEDWYIHPERVPESLWRCYQNLDDHGLPKYYYDTLFTTT